MATERSDVRSSSAEIDIHAAKLTKQFGDQYAVKDVSFDIPRGKIFGFIGPSGSGKTTAVRLLTGIYPPTAGTARVLGVEPMNFTQHLREEIGYMPQLFALYPDLTVWENLNFVASLYGMNFVTRRKRLRELLEFVELDKDRRKLARSISGGMQRRLTLAATLAHDPRLLFLDEPTAGIDPVLRRKFWDHFKTLQDSGRTLFVTTQYVGEAAYCDYVGVMTRGQLVLVETPQGLRKRAYGGELVDIVFKDSVSERRHLQPLQQFDFVQKQLPRAVQRTGRHNARIVVDDAGAALPALMKWFGDQEIEIENIEEHVPPFDDVFVEIVSKAEAEMDAAEANHG
ncbi:MAG: ABC transporter ATP-binding protein [Anaerolineales bacterium]|nr:ABC transporter ATP-binding protein [Anaerolineales bacterium]MCB9127006.1 ABC transporter ATP-binding protein [Ardenticatenales bacterium]MCB9172366.1 ABC transporter ATP-binding protein [Ardenticatenales bacterium]